jgi:hypothetical protein
VERKRCACETAAAAIAEMQGRHDGASANALLLQFVTALRNVNRTAARVDCLSGATCGQTLHLHGGAAARNDHEHISMASFFFKRDRTCGTRLLRATHL